MQVARALAIARVTGIATAGSVGLELHHTFYIPDLKNACRADQLNCHGFWANQFRLLLHGAAYWLLDTLRRWLVQAGSVSTQLDTLRLRLLKIGGRVLQMGHRVRLRLASSHPGQSLWFLLASCCFMK